MKTILSSLSILALLLGTTLADAARLDLSDWFVVVMVAALFGLALNDRGRPAWIRPAAR